MGNKIMGKFRKNRYMGFQEDQVDYLNDKWFLISTNDVADVKKFSNSYNLTEVEAKKFINFMDVDKSGSLDNYKFKVGSALLCQSPPEQTAQLLFGFFDLDNDQFLGPKDMRAFTRTVMANLAYYDEEEPPIDNLIDERAVQLMTKWDCQDKDGKLSFLEFQLMLKKDPDVLRLLFEFGFITKAELKLEETDYNDLDSELEAEVDKAYQERDERIERIKNGIEHVVQKGPEEATGLEEEDKKEAKPWLDTVKDQTPTGFKQTPDLNTPPNACLELEYIYGYRCHDSRQNLRYGNKGQVVYPVAGVGVSLDSTTLTQKHFLEHSDDITCLDVWENLVVTGQMGLHPLLIIWEINALRLKCVWKDQLMNGIANTCFSNDGTMVAAIGMDEDHSLAIYDIAKGIAYRNDPKNPDFGLIATGKITKRDLFDIKFVPGDWQIIIACMKEVNLITWKDGTLLAERTIWKDAKPQAALCIGFVDGFAVTGMFSGQFYVWRENQLDRTVKAHPAAVQDIWTRSNGRGLISAGKRGVIMVWDQQLNKKFEIDTRDLGLPLLFPPGPFLNSVCESPDGKILFGTKRSEIVEVQPYVKGQKLQSKLIMQGHYQGELWGIASHPSSLTFYTVGLDELLAQWDAKNKRIIKSVDVGHASKTCHVSPNGKLLAIGACSGRVLIHDANSLKQIATITEVIDPDKETLSILKFSPNSELLAVTYSPPVNEIVFYSTKSWKRVKTISGVVRTRVMCLDYSVDGKYIQVNTTANKLFYLDIQNQCELKNGPTQLKDEKWSTWSCVFGWSMQGVWPPCSDGQDINAADRSIDGDTVAIVDDFGKVKLFRFPCPIPQSGFAKYTGHSSMVTNVQFTYDGQYILSTGGDELSIFQWKYVKFTSSLQIDHNAVDSKNQSKVVELPDDDADQGGGPAFEQGEIDKGDKAGACKPFIGELNASVPSWYKPNAKRDNVLPKGTLTPYHIMGFRYFYILDECRDMCGYTDTGSIAFAAAALGVEMDIKTQQQSFFNLHEEDIVSFAIHPSRKIAASGQMAQAGKAKCIDIFVWDIEKKEKLANFNDFHLRAIVLLRFSPDGTLLLSVGQDDDNSLAIHDWQANRMIVTSNIDKAKVNGAAWASQDEFVTVGNKHIKFWKIAGRNVQGKMGQQGGKFESQFTACYAFGACISGGGEGNLFVWKGGSADKGIPAHPGGKVQCLIFDKDKALLYSGGVIIMDGKICAWGYEGGTLIKKQEIFDLSKVALFPPGITAMDLQPKTGNFLIGTCSAQIYQYEPTTKKSTLILQGHYGDELWACCASPNSHKFVSAGADKTVRIWDIDTRKMVIATKPFENDIRSVDWASNNKFIVCGDMLGFIYLLDPNTLETKDKGATKFTKMPKRQSTYWIEDIKISPDCKNVAFGAHGAASHVEMWSINYPKFGKGKEINAGLTSALLHIDWSTDSAIALINSQAYEMKFVDMNSAKNAKSSSCKDVEFATWTCKLGFPVQGVFPGADFTDVNTVCRSQSKKYLASGEDTQKVVLFKYPVVVPKQKRKEYIGHSSHVTRVRFSYDDNFLLSTGGNDKSIIIWKTDFGSQPAADLSKECAEEGQDDCDAPQEKTGNKKKKVEAPVVEEKKDPDDIFDSQKDQGDQFMAVKPWMGAIKEPSQPYYNNKKVGHKPPPVDLAIEYVYGYRTKDMRSNLYYLKSGKVLYNAAAVGIVLDIATNTQTFFGQHEDDITAIDMNPADRTTVATGELGAKPNLFVWDAETKAVKCSFKGILKKGVISLAFSPSGKRLVGGAVDVDHYLAVFDVSGAGSVLWTDKGGPDTILDLRFNDEDNWTTIGVKHYYIWTLANGTTKKNKGSFGPKACNKLSGIAVNGADIVCGASDGSVQVWKGTALAKELDPHHSMSCDCIHVTPDYVMSGGRDGMVLIFDKTYAKLSEINCKELLPMSVLPAVRALYLNAETKTLLIGTLSSEIYEVSFNTPKINAGTQFTIKTEAMKGHYSPNLQWTNEVWGLDVFRNDLDKFATCSDDGTLRIFSASQRKQIAVGFSTFDKDGLPEKPDHATGDLQDKCKGRAIAVAPDDKQFVVGCKDGTMRIFDENLKQTKVFKKAKEWISDIRFSPDGTVMVHGSHDNAMYAQKWPGLQMVGPKPMLKHSSYITHFDFSCDGVNLHSTCGAYELLFWDVAGAKQLPGGASALKDEKWFTWSTPFGFPVQGIWPECTDGTDINMIDRSHATLDGKNDPKTSYYLLASGDDFSHVRILRYPSLQKASESVEGRGHSSHVTNVKFNNDDTKIFSTGGEDQCVFQWTVAKKKKVAE